MRSTFRRWTAVCALTAPLLLPHVSAACVGDCNDDRQVTMDELVRAVDIALGADAVSACDAIDNNRDGAVGINELIRGVGKALAGCGGGPAGEVLFSPQNNELDEYDLASGAVTATVPSTHAHINGQVCLLPGGAGSYVAGEDTGQPAVRPGWGIFSADGTFLQKITLPAFANESTTPDPLGCVVDADGRLFGTAIGTPGGGDGHLVVFFPPDYATSCTLDSDLQTPGLMTSDDAGNVYVAESGPPGKVERYAPPFPANAGECATVPPTKTPFIAYSDAVASLGVTRGRGGHFFVSQVVGLDGNPSGIREHAADGTFILEILPAGDWGNPAGMA
ncbi:MAG TPA: hypothetical protein VL049_11410, partial [Candidatus Dormibacteraeota bacterium]|nr:hypothetical protein [Candidatus Dormibacteraeota bacterium]